MAKDNKRKKSRSQSPDSNEPTVESAAADDGSNKKKKRKLLPSLIKNKEKRSQVHAKLKKEKKIEKRKQAKARDAAHKRALELGQEAKIFSLPLSPILFLYFFGRGLFS